MMKPTALVRQYQAERQQLLETISELLAGDARVKAAWLVGSLGRGDADALSDIDLWVVVEDAQPEAIAAQLHAFASQPGETVLFLEAPQNAPEGGAYRMACYDAPAAPHIVDWYCQPRSMAAMPSQARLLFDRAGLRHTDQPFRIPERQARQESAERPLHYASFFWMMLLIAAKQIYRQPRADEMELLPYLIQPVEKARRFVGQEGSSEGGERTSLIPRPFSPRGGERRGEESRTSPLPAPGRGDRGGLGQNGKEHNRPRSPSEKIRLLRELAVEMSQLMAALAERGEAVPVSIVPGAARYLDMVEAAVNSFSKPEKGASSGTRDH